MMISKKIFTEWGLYVLLIVMFVINISGFFLGIETLRTLKKDDAYKFAVLKSNQDTLLCIVRESTNPVHTTFDAQNFKFVVDNSYIDKCIRDNRVR